MRSNQDQTWEGPSPDDVAGQRKHPDENARSPPKSGYHLGANEAE